PHPLGDPSNAPLTAINTMIYIGNIEILTAKSAIYLGNVGVKSPHRPKGRRQCCKCTKQIGSAYSSVTVS
ncbi:hypothetical protein, partial [Sphingomonas sp. DC1100-1]|uniref:hypothetical protein n=1 Tax=unclassified Sphingomonas TaxID=196159 RepID=UPI003CE77459